MFVCCLFVCVFVSVCLLVCLCVCVCVCVCVGGEGRAGHKRTLEFINYKGSVCLQKQRM